MKTKCFKVICPKCKCEEGTVKLDLYCIPECECSECNETFTADEAVAEFVAMAERWGAVAAWIKTAPTP